MNFIDNRLPEEIDMNIKDLVSAFMERNKGYNNFEDAKKKLLEIFLNIMY